MCGPARFGKAVSTWWAESCDELRSNGSLGFVRTVEDVCR